MQAFNSKLRQIDAAKDATSMKARNMDLSVSKAPRERGSVLCSAVNSQPGNVPASDGEPSWDCRTETSNMSVLRRPSRLKFTHDNGCLS